MDVIESLVGPLRSLPSDELNSLRDRIDLRLRRAFRYGIGHWVLGILFLALALGCIRSFWVLQKAHDDDILDRVEALLATPQEPAPADVYTGLISAVLTPINRTPYPLDRRKDAPPEKRDELRCSDEHPDCHAATTMRENVKKLISLALSDPETRSVDVAVGVGAALKFEGIESSERPQILARASKVLELVRANLAKKPFPSVGCKAADAAVPRVAAWGPQACLPSHRSTETHLVVPAREFPTATDRSITEMRLRRAAWLSELIEPAIAAAKPRADRDSRSDFRLVQAYFISADGLLRFWTAGEFPASLESRRESFASVHYFTQFLSKQQVNETEFETETYVDTGGNGFVRTKCSAIDSPINSELVGVFCTDIKLPEAPVATAIADSAFFEVFELVLPDLRRPVTTLNIELTRIDPARPAGAMDAHLDEVALKGELLKKAQSSELRNDRVQLLEVPSDRVGFQRVSLIPMKSRGDLLTRALIVVPTTPVLALSAPLLVAGGGSLVLSALLIAASLTRARRAHDYAHRLSVLRNLPVGVLEVNEDEDILLGNDRAEEVLGRQLPKSQPSAINLNFREDIIGDFVVPSRDGKVGVSLKKYDEEVSERRRRDESSTYYACLRGTGRRRWIRITAVPVLSEGLDLSARLRGTKPPATFGIVEKPTPDEQRDLLALVEEWEGRNA